MLLIQFLKDECEFYKSTKGLNTCRYKRDAVSWELSDFIFGGKNCKGWGLKG